MKALIRREREGQVLVMVALALLVLFSIVGLAVDGGHLYRERRYMQNAADSGALAGAYELCYGEMGTADAAIAAAKDYAIAKNGAEGAEVTVTHDITVTVVTSETARTFFAGLIGFRDVEIRAEAAAVCSTAVSAGLVWPIGYAKPAFTNECNQQVILWADGDVDCSAYDCCTLYPVKLNDDGSGGGVINGSGTPVTVVDTVIDANGYCRPANWPGDERAWIDFSAGLTGTDPCNKTGCGNVELEWRIIGSNGEEDCQSFLEIPSCMPNDNGVRDTTWRKAHVRRGDLVGIPLYDPYYSKGGPEPCGFHDPGNHCSDGNFYITGIGCIRVDDVYMLPKADDKNPSGKSGVRVILGHIPCIVDGNGNLVRDPACDSFSGQAGGGAEPEPGDVTAVRLVK